MTDRRDALALSLLAGRYRLGPLVGRGGMADVHAAVDERTGARVAVKLFRDPLAPGAEGEVRNGDVRALEGMRHPGLVELLDVGEDAGRPFCVMTLVEGPTLAERLSQGPLGREAVARIGSDLAAALAYVHDRGVVHRDVKPANVLLGADGRARLADFGIARLVDATRVTRSGFTIGTAGYLAPEQVTGDRITPAADVYALGLVLLECLTGLREYDGPVIEAALARLHRRPRVAPELPAGWQSFLRALTADDPADRPTAAIAASAAGVLADQPAAPAEALRLDRLAREPGPSVVVPNEPLAAAAGAVLKDSRQDDPVGPDRRPDPAAATAAAPLVRRGRPGRPRLLVAAGGAALVLAAAGTAVLATADDPSAQAGASAAPSVTGGSAAAPLTPEQGLADATGVVQAAVVTDPVRAGESAPAVLARLRAVAGLEGPAQASTALALADDVQQSVGAGRLDAPLGQRVQDALDRVAAQDDLVGLVRLSRHDLQALGTDGSEVERLLTALDHDTATRDVPATARRLLDRVGAGAATGRVSPAFVRVSTPVLEPLARPEALEALRTTVDELSTSPQADSATGRELVGRLEGLVDDDVYTRTLAARALLRDVYDAADQGALPGALRDRLVAVLTPLTQQRAAGS